MPRQPRGIVYAGTYHVWRRTAGPVLMFHDDFDRTSFCNYLATAIADHGWTCLAFVLMPSHFHLILTVPDNSLPAGMRRAFGPYAQAFNRRWGRSGHLRAGPYKLRRARNDRDLEGLVGYVARNPVRARLCERPQDWYWSSYASSAGYARRFPFVDDRPVLDMLHPDTPEAQRLLRASVEKGVRG